MAIGEFNKVVAFKSNSASALGAGLADSFSTYCTTRGRLRRLSGSRGLSFGEMVGNDSFELTVRRESLLDTNLSLSNKVLIDSVTYTIDSIEKIEEKRFYYKLVIRK